jgi:hypothetical protein
MTATRSSTTPLARLVDEILERAIERARNEAVPIYTFALYHDHESAALSVCIDTEENSRRCVAQMNRYGKKQFADALTRGNLAAAALWKANVGRSLSLGNFALVDVERRDLGPLRNEDDFYLALVRALTLVESPVLALSPDPERTLFCCSGADDETQYLWSGYADR